MAVHPVVCWALAILGGACELLAAFGIPTLGPVQLLPLGLVFLFAAVAIHHPHV
jgi:hypothetical protein